MKPQIVRVNKVKFFFILNGFGFFLKGAIIEIIFNIDKLLEVIKSLVFHKKAKE